MLTNQEGNAFIKEKILSGKPFIASKMGGVEQNVIICKMNGNYEPIRGMASANAGITPADDYNLNYFSERYIDALSKVDILGHMPTTMEKHILSTYAPQSKYSELRLLEPFYFDSPWSETLKGKKVLVIHPFEATILKQFVNRKKLFANEKVLPDFTLITIKSEQTNGGGMGNDKPFKESLELMENKIHNIDFDVAIIGCGAYGLPIASVCKSMGKQAIHIGGGLQILFGIKGKRWDVHPEISAMYNDSWVRPMDSEKTINFHSIEGGTYW
tara:strand:+ start:4554 stop:5366 length:813 start_codon:yes stop_codon:yes gene_type:complete